MQNLYVSHYWVYGYLLISCLLIYCLDSKYELRRLKICSVRAVLDLFPSAYALSSRKELKSCNAFLKSLSLPVKQKDLRTVQK